MLKHRPARSTGWEILVIGIVGLLVAGAFIYRASGLPTASVGSGRQTGAAPPAAPASPSTSGVGDWPPMTVVYRVDGVEARLAYVNARQWRTDVLKNPAAPDMVGFVSIFDGTTYTDYTPNTVDLKTGQPAKMVRDLPDGVALPERWLRPDFATMLAQRNFVVSAFDGRLQYRNTLTYACATPEPGRPALPNQPAACASGNTFDEVETYTFRTDVTPPIVSSFTIERDGKVISQAEIVSLDLTPPVIDLSGP